MARRRLWAASICGAPCSRLRLWVRARLVLEQRGLGEVLEGEMPLLVRARPGGGVGRDPELPARAAAQGGWVHDMCVCVSAAATSAGVLMFP